MPFLPLYIRELGVTDVGDIALWAGMATGITPAVAALCGPLWGRVADRFGEKILVQRSLVSFVVVMCSMAYATEAWHLFALRALQGFVGEDADFDNARPGTGADVRLSGTLRPTDHIELRLNTSRRWLDVDPPDQPGGRLFTAQVERVRATYTFTSRVFLRLIGQYVDTRRDPSLYIEETAPRDASFSGSALFAYKLNWQTVLFVGYGDNRALSEEETFEREDRQFFLKLSYAFQR